MSSQFSERLRWGVSIVLLALVALFVLVSWQTSPADDSAAALIEAEAVASPVVGSNAPVIAPSASPTLIAVDVIGAVQQPGMYMIAEPARVATAIDAAGGLAPNADRERINLAAPVADGEQLRVPAVGETMDETADVSSAPHAAATGLIDVNTADASTLEQLPGIGPATAQAIIAYREEHGPFPSVDALDAVAGIGPATLDKFRDQVMVGP